MRWQLINFIRVALYDDVLADTHGEPYHTNHTQHMVVVVEEARRPLSF